ncbi:Hypothetical predicted protein [Cloeon dipterum]|uniref:ATP-dependent RNA helicase SUV3 homolog, mitochondrial n=1 Tax=Cloeon dipterum TaxID=197152 RepID=A0A8S1CP90_9INSE|nr:Hypothetical predicted protein [Cloeon dipterum]
MLGSSRARVVNVARRLKNVKLCSQRSGLLEQSCCPVVSSFRGKKDDSSFSHLFVPVPVKPSSDDINIGAELTGAEINKDDLLRVLNKFYQRKEIKNLAKEHGLDHHLMHQAYVSFRRYCLEAAALPADLHIILADILQGAGAVDSIFPYFLRHAKTAFPHLECMDDLRKISDLREPANWYPEARALTRKVIFHAGPTNSGKTYHALERFMSAKSGVYCGPLKLLAVEVFNKSNTKGTPCDLVTGEERRCGNADGSAAQHVACTVEMTSLNQHFEVAVIDEIQMMKDDQRGWAWTRALLGVQADEIHVCGEPGTGELLQSLLNTTGEDLEIRNYKRLTKLEVETTALGTLSNVLPGDCIVCFSKVDIYSVSRQIEALGNEVAVIYGGLPPGTKLAQASKFNDPKNPCKILVATDAIGMGLNLSIKRVIFYSLIKPVVNERGEKEMDTISVSSALQIAGRAGRYGTEYENGRVTTFKADDLPVLKSLLSQTPDPIKKAGLHPTADQIELYAYHLPNSVLSNLMDIFVTLSTVDDSLYFICNIEDFKFLADMIQHVPLPLRARYVFCCAPINKKMPFVCTMFLKFARQYSKNEAITFDWLCRNIGWPFSAPRTIIDLVHLEAVFDVLDLYLWLSYRFMDLFPDANLVRDMQNELDAIIQQGVFQLTRLLKNSEQGRDEDEFTMSRYKQARMKKRIPVEEATLPSGRLTERLLAQGLLTPNMLQELRKEWNQSGEEPAASVSNTDQFVFFACFHCQVNHRREFSCSTSSHRQEVVKMEGPSRRRLPLLLTLDNFDCVEARDSPYVLTSPRSLEACKVLGIKPVELLYQSLEEVRQKLGESASLDRVISVYQNLERERRSKIEACKAVRDHLSLSTTADIKENQNPSPKSRKEQIERDNNNVARHDKALRSLENNSEETSGESSAVKSTPPSKQGIKAHGSPNSRKSPTSSALKKGSFLIKSPSPILKNISPSSSRKSSPTQIPAPTFKVSATPRRRSIAKTRPRTVPNRTCARSPPLRKSSFGFPYSAGKNRVTRFSPDCGRPKSSTSYSSSLSGSHKHYPRRLINSATTTRSSCLSPFKSARSSSKWTSGSDLTSCRKSLFGEIKSQLNLASATIPEHDRRILDSMVLKREQEIAAKQLAFESHQAWEEAREERNKEKEKQACVYRDYLNKKRRLENEMSERKMALLKKEEQEAKMRLQQNLAEKEMRVAANLKAVAVSKSHGQGDKADALEQQRAAVASAREQIQEQMEQWRQGVGRRQVEKLNRAHEARERSAEHIRRRVASANRVEEMRRAERKKLMEEERNQALAAMRAKCEEKLKKAETRLSTISVDKERNLKGQSEARTVKFESARRMHAELEQGLQQWRQHCRHLQTKAAEDAAKRATQQYLEKKRKAESANKAKEEHHTIVMSRISANQNALLEARRSALLAKEDKMRRLQLLRESSVHESRSTAQSTALLRDSVRTLTPDTFDKLVARTALETRVTASRSSTISSLPTSSSKSHILLG